MYFCLHFTCQPGYLYEFFDIVKLYAYNLIYFFFYRRRVQISKFDTYEYLYIYE